MDSYLQYRYEHRLDDNFTGCSYYIGSRPITAILVKGKTLEDALEKFESESGIKILEVGKATKIVDGNWKVDFPKMNIPNSFRFPNTGDFEKDWAATEKNSHFATCHFLYGKSIEEIIEIEKEYAKALAKDEANAKREEKFRQRELARQQKLQQEREEKEEHERAYREQQEREKREKRKRYYTPSNDKITVTDYTREWRGGDEGWVTKEQTRTIDRNKYGL